MKSAGGNPKICKKGHRYFKSSDCPVCPQCEKIKNEEKEYFVKVAAPARRALENLGIFTLKQLAKYTVAEILSSHGMGPGSIPKLRSALKAHGLTFRK